MNNLDKVSKAFELINISAFARRYYYYSRDNFFYKLYRAKKQLPNLNTQEAHSIVRGFEEIAKMAQDAADEIKKKYTY